MKREAKMTEKPITLVTTFERVEGYKRGLHHGRDRDVLIAGNYIGTSPDSFLFEKDVNQAYRETFDYLRYFTGTPRLDAALVYMGRPGVFGTTPGFEYVRELKEGMQLDVKLVACECSAENKKKFAFRQELQIIWAECGGYRTLGQLVNELLR